MQYFSEITKKKTDQYECITIYSYITKLKSLTTWGNYLHQKARHSLHIRSFYKLIAKNMKIPLGMGKEHKLAINALSIGSTY